MNTKLKTHEIGRLLDHSAARLDTDTLDRLRTARRVALKNQRHPSPVLVWLGQHGIIQSHAMHAHKVINLAVVVLLAALLLGGSLYWHRIYEHDHAELDIAILTDELPLDMYVD